MGSMRRAFRRSALLLILLIAAAGAVEFLNRAGLPVQARRWLERSASEALGRKVTAGRVRIHLWHGFMAEDVQIEEDPRFGEGPFLQAEKISGGILILPLLKDRQVIIPTLHLQGLTLRLAQNAQGVWNVEPMLRKPTQTAPAPLRIRLAVLRVVLSGGRIRLTTARLQPPETLEIREMEADVHLRLPTRVEGNASARIQLQEGLPPDATAQISVRGIGNLQDRSMELTAAADGTLEPLLAFASRHLTLPVRSAAGTIGCSGQLTGRLPGPLTIEAHLQSRGLRWQAAVRGGLLQAEGEIKLSARTEVATLRKPDFLSALEGSLQLQGISLSHLPQIRELQKLEGRVDFDARGIRTERLTAALPAGGHVEVSGSVANDAQRAFGIRAAAELQLESPPELPGKLSDFLREKKARGPVHLEWIGNGALRPRFEIATRATARLGEVQAELGRGMPLALDGGLIRWEDDLVTFTGLQGRLAGRPVRLDGSVVREAQPELTATLAWGGLSAEAHLSLTEDTVQIEGLTGRLGEGSFRILGQFGRATPEGNLYAEAALQLEELYSLWPEGFGWIRARSLQGPLSLRCSLEGNLSKPDACDVELRVNSPALEAGKIPLEELSLQLRQSAGELTLESARARVAGGWAELAGSWDRTRPKSPWAVKAGLEGVELERLAALLDWKAQRFSGQLTGEWEGRGLPGELSSIEGAGTLQVTGARILELPLLGGFADFLGLPTLRSIQFQEAVGGFALREGRVETDSLQIRSPRATLTIVGWGGFLQGTDSPIRWKVLPTFTPDLLPEESRSRIGRVITQGARYFLGEVQLGGTWKQPKRKFVPKPMTQILNEQIFNLEDLLKEIF